MSTPQEIDNRIKEIDKEKILLTMMLDSADADRASGIHKILNVLDQERAELVEKKAAAASGEF